MDDQPKSKISSDLLLGLAAVIASIAIPVAQFLVGYYEQKTAQMQNIVMEQEKRRLEITKMFMDNYVGKPAEQQMATVQIMKSLDPTFFISIENGLKEATKSDSVKATIRKATLEAASELTGTSNHVKTPKITKVLSSKEYEEKAFEYLQKGDTENANKYFDKAHKEYPIYTTSSSGTFKQLDEKTQQEMDKELYRQLYKNSEGFSDSTRRALKRLSKGKKP